METYYWFTLEPHSTNTETMLDFIENHLLFAFKDDVEIFFNDGSYAEARTADGKVYSLNAGGNGDFCSHKVEFNRIT